MLRIKSNIHLPSKIMSYPIKINMSLQFSGSSSNKLNRLDMPLSVWIDIIMIDRQD